jgi:sortase A
MMNDRQAKLRKSARTACIAFSLIGATAAASGAVIPIKASIAQLLLNQAYDARVASGQPQKPWSGADMSPIGKISVPRLGISEIILDAGTRQAMRAGPTLMPGSAALGQAGTSILAAHRDTHFQFLKDVRVGDAVEIAGTDGTPLLYRVTHMQVVEADSFRIAAHLDHNELALSTCYPFGAVRGGTKRYVVHAIPAKLYSEAKGFVGLD